MKRLTVMLIAATALVLVACGGKTLDTVNVEKDIQEIASSGGAEAEAKCPDEVSDAEEGKAYECEITYGGNENNVQTIEMTIADDDATSDFADQEAAADEVAIRSIIANTDTDPGSICDHFSSELRQQVEGGLEGCRAQAVESDDGEPTEVKSLTIEGDTATAVTTGAEGESTTTFQRGTQGEWLITGAG